jgi:hypothetical protein
MHLYFTPLRGFTFEALPLGSCALSPTMLPQLETFLELLLWNSFQYRRHIFFGCFQYPEIFVLLGHTLFLETVKSNDGVGMGVPVQ